MRIERIERDIRQILAEFDADAADELLNESERADLWTDIDVPVEGLRALLDELSRLREENQNLAAEAHSYLSQLLQPDARTLSEREGQEGE